MSEKKEFQHITKDEFMQSFNIDELLGLAELPDTEVEEDIGDFDYGGTSSQPDIQKNITSKEIPGVVSPPEPKKYSVYYKNFIKENKERAAMNFKSTQKRLSLQLDAYDPSICSTINNQFCFMPVGQLLSSSYYYERMKSIKKNQDVQPAMYKNIEQLLIEYLGLIDTRFSLFKSTLLIQKTANLFYAENLYALDLNYFHFGYSREKYSVMTPFMLIELLEKKPLKKHHLAALFDDLEFFRLPSNSNADNTEITL
ncbi:hypothetical protein AO073_01605 [Pseudomonas syringae ICMP 11293]|uniref:hypothetical protein n=1 Tax=Pseudomonas syringae TaxID=317 RepID=UPI0007306201|nr:hypothetical protein [Pseudomonas syringae]KTB91596.1 hypothetical protein AO073_01605 [Pseudomonas syringae ICMP 11293]